MKTKKEFNLSKKIRLPISMTFVDGDGTSAVFKAKINYEIIVIKHIKEFIKLVRKECESLQDNVRKDYPCFNWRFLVKGMGLDKLAGDKLK